MFVSSIDEETVRPQKQSNMRSFRKRNEMPKAVTCWQVCGCIRCRGREESCFFHCEPRWNIVNLSIERSSKAREGRESSKWRSAALCG